MFELFALLSIGLLTIIEPAVKSVAINQSSVTVYYLIYTALEFSILTTLMAFKVNKRTYFIIGLYWVSLALNVLMTAISIPFDNGKLLSPALMDLIITNNTIANQALALMIIACCLFNASNSPKYL